HRAHDRRRAERHRHRAEHTAERVVVHRHASEDKAFMSAFCKILLADDDPEIREVIALVLEPHGFQTVLAADGNEALILLCEHPDVGRMWADSMIRGRGGAELVGVLKRDARFGGIPVVVPSADNYARQKALDLGATECLRKPVELSKLVETLSRLTHRL